SLDLHESVPLMYVSGGTGPYNPNVDPVTIREWQWAASYELAELQKQGLPGVWTWGFYTGWNPSYLLWVTNNHNSMGRFYETFGNMSPKTMKRDLSNSTFAGKKLTSQQWYRADPPDKKVTWSLRNNTNYMQSGVIASLRWLSNNGKDLLDNFYKKGENAIRNGTTEKPYAWVIPADQADPSRVAYLVNQLGRHKIEVHRATKDFEIDETEYKQGDFVVRLDQPYGGHARNLLAKQLFPKDAEHRPYDDVSWTLGLIYRVQTDPIEDEAILEMDDLSLVTETVRFPGTVSGDDPAAYALKHTGGNTMISARYALKKFKISAVEEAFESGDETYPAGSWIIPHKRGLKGTLEQVADEFMLDFDPIDAIPDVATHELDLPRIALLHNWVSTQNDGWVRYTLEQQGIPYDYIADYTVRAGGLRSKFDVIIMAHQGGMSAKGMVHGRDPKFGPQAYTSTKEFPSHGYVDSARDITSGIGFEGLGNLEKFLNKGGTLLLLGSSGRLATDFGLVRNVSTSRAGVQTPGSAIQTKILRPDHPITYGYDEINQVFRTNGPLYTVPKKFDHWIVMQYGTKPLREDEDDEDDEKDKDDDADSEESESNDENDSDDESEEEGDDKKSKEDKKSFLLSGYVDAQDKIEKKGAIIDIPRNAGGRVILFSFNPLHRYLNHGDHTYVHNALLNWNDYPDPEPKDHAGLMKD
ncbi:MAG: peptidase, partial [Candidatus Hydrogenedentota bacterium]